MTVSWVRTMPIVAVQVCRQTSECVDWDPLTTLETHAMAVCSTRVCYMHTAGVCVRLVAQSRFLFW